MVSLCEVLNDGPITASAPCRVDFGGTWDLPAFWLPYVRHRPATVNIALNLRTHVTLTPFDEGWTSVSSSGFESEESRSASAPFNTPLGLVFAIASHFNVTGLQIEIRSDSPPRSALGGSGVVSVALIHALSKAMTAIDGEALGRWEMVRLATAIEAGLAVSFSGSQDQAAAAFGGVNRWSWGAGGSFSRDELLIGEDIARLGESMLVGYCGEPHHSSTINARWIESFLSGKERKAWLGINDLTHRFSEAIRELDIGAASAAMRRETALRCELTPEVLIPVTKELAQAATDWECGARFTGAGGGGCVWAVGQKNAVTELRAVWQRILDETRTGAILDADIDTVGVC